MVAAARITCSSWARFTAPRLRVAPAARRPAGPGIEKAAERRRLAELTGALARVLQEERHLAGRPGEDLAPRFGVRPRHGPVAKPVLDASPRPLDQRRFGPEAFCDRAVELEARVLGDGVASVCHGGSLAPADEAQAMIWASRWRRSRRGARAVRSGRGRPDGAGVARAARPRKNGPSILHGERKPERRHRPARLAAWAAPDGSGGCHAMTRIGRECE